MVLFNSAEASKGMCDFVGITNCHVSFIFMENISIQFKFPDANDG